MRADPALYDLVAPPTLKDALALIANEPAQWTPIAGGTDLMVLYSAGTLPPRKLLSLNGYRELRGILATPSELAIGASATYSDIRRHPVIRHEFPLLARAASWIGGIANQNRGTLGGNIANASPAGDSLPVLLVYNADLLLISTRGQRLIPYSTFHTGYKKSIIAPNELIHSIILNRASKIGMRHYVKKVGARNAQAISKVYLAAVGRDFNGRADSIRLAAGSVGPTPIRLIKSEQALEGISLLNDPLALVSKVLAEEIAPIDDIRSTARYRSTVLSNLLGEFLGMLAHPVMPIANPTLTRWNTLPAATAAAEILPCCGSRNWANSLVAERPFDDLSALHSASDRIWRELSEADWLEGFRSHPRIGESRGHTPASAQSQKWSAQEQSRSANSPEAVKQALAAGNQEYERKFARIFIICATGKSAAEILQNLQRRLQNDQAAELHEAAEQHREIIHIRLGKWLTA